MDRGREVDRVLVPSFGVGVTGGDSRDSASASMPRRRHDVGMRISARADYAVRAVIEVAAADPARAKSDQIASTQAIPVKFLEQIMADLRRVGIVASKRGADGGYVLGRPATEITVADVIRAVDGPLAWVRDVRPSSVEYEGRAEPLRDVWVAVRAALRGVLDHVTIAELLSGELPDEVTGLIAGPEAWQD